MKNSNLSVGSLVLAAADIGKDSSLPPVHRMRNIQHTMRSALREDAGLYLGYGVIPGTFPYAYQDNYKRELTQKSYTCVVLENRYLKALFLPELGGRLWSLFDKENQRELLFVNPVLRFCNLSLRNAWFSGGVEFNCGPIGHHPHTCECIHSARLETEDNTPVLRMYEYERIRSLVYQIDTFLPADSRQLFMHVQIMNQTGRTVPAYWWSNIASPAYKGGRVLVNAETAYSNIGGSVEELSLQNGKDITYPENSSSSIDYFWNIKEQDRKAIAHIGQDGYGLMQCSTARQKGRKLFVWGQTRGSQNWQDLLSDENGGGNYVEIQAGLGQTQYECVPMPPYTTWEWVEAYGAIQTDTEKSFGDWNAARSHFDDVLGKTIPLKKLNEILVDCKRKTAKAKAQEIITYGQKWAMLENIRREYMGEPSMTPHLEFAEISGKQKYWLELLQGAALPESDDNLSYMYQPEWTDLLKQSVKAEGRWNWATHMHLGLIELAENRIEESKPYLTESLSLKRTAWAMSALSVQSELDNNPAQAARYALAMAQMRPQDVNFQREAAKRLLNAGMYKGLLSYLQNLKKQPTDGRVLLCKAFALLNSGDLEAAEALLNADGGLVVPDMRERENSVTELWFAIQKSKSEKNGSEYNPTHISPPKQFDFRLDA